MKKILFPLVSIFAVVALVGGTAYALWNDSVDVQGVTFAAGTKDIKISLTGEDGTWKDTLNVTTDFQFTDLYPGYVSNPPQTFWLKNKSSVDYNIIGTLVLPGDYDSESWGAMYENVKVAVVQGSHLPEDAEGYSTGYHSLKEWRNDMVAFPVATDPLGDGQVQRFRMFVMVDPDTGNDFADKELSDMTFVFTGTQVP